MAAMKVVPGRGNAVTTGSPREGEYPKGCGSMPEKIVARSTEMKVKKAERSASVERPANVRGNEQIQQIMAETMEKTTVHWLWFVMVLRYFAVTRTCRP